MHRLIVHSQHASDVVAREYATRSKIRILEHVDYGPPLTNLDAVQARAKHGLSADRMLLLFFGKIRPYKGTHYLLESADALDQRGVDLVVVGEPHDAHVAASIRATRSHHANIHLNLQRVDDETLSEYLVACDVVALPYASGLTSGAAHLAMSHGKPFVCSNSVAFRHFLDLGVAVECHEPNAPAPSLASSVHRAAALVDNKWHEEILRYRQRCHPHQIGLRLKAIYAELDTAYSTSNPPSATPVEATNGLGKR